MARLDDLTKLRTDLLAWIDDAPNDRKAALIGQFRATIAEIEKLSQKEETVDSIDEIAARRNTRRARPAARANRASGSI